MHLWKHRKDGIERSPKHYIHALFEISEGLHPERPHNNNTSIIDKNVYASIVLSPLLHQPLRLFTLSDIARYRQYFSPSIGKLLPCFLQFLFITRADGYTSPLQREFFSYRYP